MQEKNEESYGESEDSKKLKIYELSFLIVPQISENNLPETVSAIKALIENSGGISIAEEYPKLQPLFYEMFLKKDSQKRAFKEAFFGWFKFEIDPKKLKDIEKELKANEYILRFLLIKTLRENTMSSHKLFVKKDKLAYKKRDDTKKPEASQEEIDKSIEKLVIN
jgi:ribosomal protein S6